MYQAQKCVCCHSENIEKFSGIMAEFLIDRMTGIVHPPASNMCSTVHCLDCDYVGSELRFSPVEENRYYQNYGVGEYVYHREQYEPGISTTFHNLQMDEIKKYRKEVTIDVLKNTIDLSTVSSLLDYGGNTGEMIPDEFSNIDRYVTDVQNRVLRNGVKSITGPEESGKVDLVLCSHTMEHVSHPFDMTVDLKRYLKSDGWLYLEVPNELPVPKQGELWHEHINKFTMECLEKHMELHGFDVKFRATDKHGHTHMPLSHVIVGQLKGK